MNLLQLSFFGAKLQPVKIWNKAHTYKYNITFKTCNTFCYNIVITAFSNYGRPLKRDATHPVRTLRWPPPFLRVPPPAPSAQRSTGIPRSARTQRSGWGGSRRCRRTRLYKSRKREIEKEEGVGQTCLPALVLTSGFSQFQGLLAVLQTSSRDHKLSQNKKGAVEIPKWFTFTAKYQRQVSAATLLASWGCPAS